jgi:hypothetical protein
MTARAIYYPYIKVPNNPWFTRVLLYWDEVGAIVPYEYIEDPDRLGPYMVGLVHEQLVTQVIPGMYLWRAENFTNAFVDYVDARARRPVDPDHYLWARVHMEKLQDVGEKLCERGLARRDKANRYSPWYEVEPQTADDFMAYLAAVLGQLAEEDKFYPITDLERRLEPFLIQQPSANYDGQIQKLVLEGILPAPSEAIEPARLADFKAKYNAELQRFRRDVEDKISELSVINDVDARDRRMGELVRNMRDNVRELTDRMEQQKNWPHIDFGNLCTVVGSGLTAWKAVIDQDWRFGLGAAALSLAPAVYNAFRGSDINLEDKPLAYAALAAREFV